MRGSTTGVRPTSPACSLAFLIQTGLSPAAADPHTSSPTDRPRTGSRRRRRQVHRQRGGTHRVRLGHREVAGERQGVKQVQHAALAQLVHVPLRGQIVFESSPIDAPRSWRRRSASAALGSMVVYGAHTRRNAPTAASSQTDPASSSSSPNRAEEPWRSHRRPALRSASSNASASSSGWSGATTSAYRSHGSRSSGAFPLVRVPDRSNSTAARRIATRYHRVVRVLAP